MSVVGCYFVTRRDIQEWASANMTSMIPRRDTERGTENANKPRQGKREYSHVTASTSYPFPQWPMQLRSTFLAIILWNPSAAHDNNPLHYPVERKVRKSTYRPALLHLPKYPYMVHVAIQHRNRSRSSEGHLLFFPVSCLYMSLPRCRGPSRLHTTPTGRRCLLRRHTQCGERNETYLPADIHIE